MNSLAREQIRNRLKFKSIEERSRFRNNFPDAQRLLEGKGVDLGKIRDKSAKLLGTGTIAGALFLAPPSIAAHLPTPQEVVDKLNLTKDKEISVRDPQMLLKDLMAYALPKRPQPLTRDQEKALEKVFENVIGIKAKATLEGEHLNTTYGYIGAEQHLYRFPGDNVANHGSGVILKEGIAPGLGAWGYFAQSKEKLTPELAETEKWYAVVQTLYLPDWNIRTRYLRDWYKYRKVLIVNTHNGNAVVAAIADSGPAAWTGKHFGGSPEVMYHLGGARYKKGPVVLFFVDDPQNKVPLGPVEYNKISLPLESLHQI